MKTSGKVGHSLPKKMGKYFKGSSSKLTRKLFDFGLEKKRKNNPVMHVQPASLARRKNKQRGRTVARYGRRHNTLEFL